MTGLFANLGNEPFPPLTAQERENLSIAMIRELDHAINASSATAAEKERMNDILIRLSENDSHIIDHWEISTNWARHAAGIATEDLAAAAAHHQAMVKKRTEAGHPSTVGIFRPKAFEEMERLAKIAIQRHKLTATTSAPALVSLISEELFLYMAVSNLKCNTR